MSTINPTPKEEQPPQARTYKRLAYSAITVERAQELAQQLVTDLEYDEDRIRPLLELLAGIVDDLSSRDKSDQKHLAGDAALKYVFMQTDACEQAIAEYLNDVEVVEIHADEADQPSDEQSE